MAHRDRQRRSARLDRLSGLFPQPRHAGPTLGDLLDAVTDPEARAVLTRCAAVLMTVDLHGQPSTAEQAHAAIWLHRALWSDEFRHDPTMADLLTLVSPVMPWPK